MSDIPYVITPTVVSSESKTPSGVVQYSLQLIMTSSNPNRVILIPLSAPLGPVGTWFRLPFVRDPDKAELKYVVSLCMVQGLYSITFGGIILEVFD